MTNKEKMLSMVLGDKTLQETYDYDANDYDNLEDALQSDNPIVVTVARIIFELNGKTDEGTQKEVYKRVFNYLNENLL